MSDINLSSAFGLSDWLGYMRHEELELLAQLCSGLEGDHPVIVNIGAGAGTSGLAMRSGNKSASIYTIDISPGGPLGGLESERNAFDNAGESVPFQILGDSKQIGKEWDKGPIALLFVDGDHLEPGVRGDVESWLPHVAEGGIIVFHDYNDNNWPPVKKVVDEYAEKEKWVCIGHKDRLIAFRVKIKPTIKKTTKRRNKK